MPRAIALIFVATLITSPQRSARPIRRVPAARRPGGRRVGLFSRDAGTLALAQSSFIPAQVGMRSPA